MKRIICSLIICLYLKCSIAQHSWHSVGGGVYSAFGTGGGANVLVADTVHNLLYIGGGFDVVGSNNIAAVKVASWDGTQYSPLGCPTGLDWDFSPFPRYGALFNNRPVFGSENPTAIPGYCGNTPNSYFITKYNGNEWQPVSSLISFMLKDLTTFRNRLVVIGQGGSVMMNTGFTTCNSIAITDSTASYWELLGDSVNYGVTLTTTPHTSYIESAFEFNGELFVNGGFNKAGSLLVSNYGHARWNGINWLDAGTMFIGNGNYGIYDNELYFGQIGSLNQADLFKWTGSDWLLSATASNSSSPSLCLIHKVLEWEGKMVVTGNFDSIGGIAANKIAMWDGVQWMPLGSGLINSNAPQVSVGLDLAVFQGSLYVAGGFDNAGGIFTTGIARWGPVVGMDELSGLMPMQVSPNPSKDVCTIESKRFNNATLTVYDITGRQLLQQPFNSKATVEISTLSKAVYIAELRDKEGRSVKGKLVKE